MKALSDEKIYEMCALFVIGDARLLERAGKIVGNDARLKQIFFHPMKQHLILQEKGSRTSLV